MPKFGHLGSKFEKRKQVENYRFPQFWVVSGHFAIFLGCFGWFRVVSAGFGSFWLVQSFREYDADPTNGNKPQEIKNDAKKLTREKYDVKTH